MSRFSQAVSREEWADLGLKSRLLATGGGAKLVEEGSSLLVERCRFWAVTEIRVEGM